MKKVLSMILLIALIAVPVGCSGQNKETSKYEAPTAAKTTSAQTTAGAETTAAPETTQEPTTAPPETTAPLSVESYIKIYKEDTYYNNTRKSDFTYVMPLFAIDSADAEAINSELTAAYDEALKQIQFYQTQPFNDGTYNVSYEAYLNDSILSLCVKEDRPASATTYHAYNIDVATGREVKNDGIAAHFGTTTKALHDNILAAVDSGYRSKFSNSAERNTSRYQKTVSDDNINAARLFIGANNALKVMCDFYWDAMIGEGRSVLDVSLD